MNHLQKLYLRRIEKDPDFSSMYNKAEDYIQEETVNLVDALFKGYMQESKLATMLSVNPNLHNLLKRCKNNLFKSLQTAKRILVKFTSMTQDEFASDKVRKQNDDLIEMLFNDADPTLAGEAARMNMTLDQGFHRTLEKGAKADDLAAAFAGRGLEGADGEGLDPERLKLFSEAAAMDILDQFGRFNQFINTTQKKRKEDGIGEMKDIVMGDDIPNMLDDHYLELLHPKMKLLFNKQYAEGELLQMEFEEEKPEDSGPVAIFVDFSSSMTRFKPIAAGFALAGFKHIEDAGRYVELHTYTNELKDSVNSETGSLYEALNVLSRPIGGGTQFGVSFLQALGNGLLGDKRCDGDIVVITDGEDVFSEHGRPQIQQLKDQGVKFSVLFINLQGGLEAKRKELSSVFDSVLIVDRISQGDKDEEVLAKKLYSLTEQIL